LVSKYYDFPSFPLKTGNHHFGDKSFQQLLVGSILVTRFPLLGKKYHHFDDSAALNSLIKSLFRSLCHTHFGETN